LTTAPAASALPTRAQLRPEQFFAQALDHHTNGEFAAASALYNELLAAHPRSPDVLHNLGLVLLQLGQKDEALKLVAAAIAAAGTREFPGQPRLASRAALLVKLGRYANAAASYELLSSALDTKSMHNQAVALGRLGRTAKAQGICKRLLGIDAAGAATHALMGNLLTDGDDFRAAEFAYHEALRLRTDDVATISNRVPPVSELELPCV